MQTMDAELLRQTYDYDPLTGGFTRRKKWGSKAAGSVVGNLSPQGYIQMCFQNRNYPAHRLAWLYVHGRWPVGDVDHINRNRADNRIANLRELSRADNLANSGPRERSQSGIKGVSLRPLRNGRRPNKAWRADIMIDGKRYFLGNFYTVEDAAAARLKAEREFW